MSLKRLTDQEYALEERGRFFIASETQGEEGNVDHHELILLKADVLASENRLKEAVDMYAIAIRYGPVRPDQLSTLVGCVLRNFKKLKESLTNTEPNWTKQDSEFDCPGCFSFIGEPVTVICGHSYCKRCLQQSAFSKCKLCSEDIRTRPEEPRLNVIVSGLLEKWFPEDIERTKCIGKAESLLKTKQYDKAIAFTSKLLESDFSNVWVWECHAEAHRGLKQFHEALEDWESCLRIIPSPERYYQKAKIFQEMGQVDESLQVFLQCLALDENFHQAKREVELILHDLLSPACENVKVGLRETTQNTSTHLRSKTLVAEGQAREQLTQVQDQWQHDTRPASTPPPPKASERPGRSETPERSGLSRTHSLRVHGLSGAVEEGLKRVCSAPQLSDPEKGALLKRKLSVSEPGPGIAYSHGSKYKKHGGTTIHATPVVTEETSHRVLPQELLDPNDFECSLCMRLFYQPVTTPCGHTFCKTCLERCLDHNQQCPLCKESLKEYLACRKYTITQVLDNIIQKNLSGEHQERMKLHIEETKEFSDLTKNVPMFVCTMAYPTVPCPLHVFEPRYRLMIRRCMETGTQQFGMCINDPQKGFVDYGCLLQIRSVHFLPDGRSVVDTIGGKRFRVLSRGMRDGYCIANIEYLEDMRVNDVEKLEKLQVLHDQVYDQARKWFQNLENRFRNQILQHFGPMPEREADIQATPNGPACCWWLLAVLPVDPRYQLSVLSMTTLKERLVKIQHILTYLQNIPSD
ncbi:LON peptidase N-terminal domain and ring finger 1, like [Triplophysa rosa]|uniref:LON peptidase N-terminal domain and RING finger protein 1 n=1 Tax=Triplophysa rosa TaxID=992332 RepID=A0A9W7WHX9_TRIRA|nr:LON peptidase N-terminal domain and ring finger 1, like [Triplophysa rosa]KAI7798123.1 LON peptidase N-terminal domain and RING finger protein 1 [Triplophysa rosa]